MQSLSRILGVLVAVALGLLVLEAAGRFAGMAPRTSIHRFDAQLGWVKLPHARQRAHTGEFDVLIETNSLGLRGPEIQETPAPGVTRILMVGDSFTLGTTVAWDDTISALLERRLTDEGRRIEVVNAGTEGWATDQEVLWLAREGARMRPSVVILQAYENDIYWSGQPAYLRFPKPRILALDDAGRPSLAAEPLRDPGPGPLLPRISGLAAFFAARFAPPAIPMLAGAHPVPAEWEPRIREDAAGWDDVGRGMRSFASVARGMGAAPLVLVIPDKAQIDPEAREQVARVLGDDPAYDPARPYRGLLARASAAGVPVVDPLADLERAQARARTAAAIDGSGALYFRGDWHTTPAGNRVLADALADALAAPGLLGPPPRHTEPLAARGPRSVTTRSWAERSIPFLGAWLALTAMYGWTHRWRGWARCAVEVGALVVGVGALVLGTSAGIALLPSRLGWWLGRAIVVGFLCACLWTLRRRLPVMVELFVTFVRRGNWYVLPVLVVLLSIGGLLVVAASSPWLAPFIYTLF